MEVHVVKFRFLRGNCKRGMWACIKLQLEGPGSKWGYVTAAGPIPGGGGLSYGGPVWGQNQPVGSESPRKLKPQWFQQRQSETWPGTIPRFFMFTLLSGSGKVISDCPTNTKRWSPFEIWRNVWKAILYPKVLCYPPCLHLEGKKRKAMN